MITAIEALHLARARLTGEELKQFQDAIDAIEAQIREHMTFAGTALDIPIHRMTGAVTKAVCLAMAKDKWNVEASLQATAPRFQGGAPIPHHWTLTIAPLPEAYVEAEAIPSRNGILQ